MSLCTANAFADSDVKVLINGEEMRFEGQEAVIMEDYTMVPFRVIFESLDAHVEWLPSSMSIVAAKGLTMVKMQIDSDIIMINGEEKTLPVLVQLVNGTTMVPLRAVSEILGSEVLWDGETKTVTITSNEMEADHKVAAQYYLQGYDGENGDRLVSVAVAYPAFTDDGKGGISKINSLYKQHAAEFAGQAIEQFGEMAETEYAQAQAEGRGYDPMVVLYGFEVTYDKFGFLSLVEQAGVNAADVFYFDAVTFNSDTADVLKKEDFISMSEEEMTTVEPYSFYLYGDQMVLCLNTNNIYLYQYYNYPPSMAVPAEYVKYDLLTGEENDIVPAEIVGEETEVSLANPRVEYSNSKQFNDAMSFKMAELKDQMKNVPVKYAMIGDSIGEITYSRDGGNAEIIVRKGVGDLNISGINSAEKIKEELYKESMVEYYKSDASIYAAFAIEKQDEIYSYSIVINNTSDLYTLQELAKEIIAADSI